MRIVVVEDERPIREGISSILHKIDAAYELAGSAANGEEGLELILNEKPDLIILDIQMPVMDGLSMLARVRRLGIEAKAIVLSAYSEFDYAKRAIELGIVNYLLKPVKIPELKRALKEAEEQISKDRSKERLLTLENLLLGAVAGKLTEDKKLTEMILKKYGISEEEPLALYGVALKEQYHKYRDMVKVMLEDVGIHNDTFQSYLVELPGDRQIMMVLYHFRDEKKVYAYFSETVQPMLANRISGAVSGVWGSCRGIKNIRETVLEMDREKEWSLFFSKEKLISKERIQKTQTYPAKYPIDIEGKARTALLDHDQPRFMECLGSLKKVCREGNCGPREMKDVCIRYFLSVLETAAEAGKAKTAAGGESVKKLSEAVNWEEIERIFEDFFESLSIRDWKEEGVSFLVVKAMQYIQEYYNQGITLEETAGKLHVTEEYLSSQFKKETGKTFTETVRECRIMHVKELLLKSSLKLNQIADMVGYSDPKYMSKVFKEEVGMLPAEYRKKNGQ